MAKIFISYSKKHAAVTERIATHLKEAGHEVWWDVNLLAGHAFRDAIKEQLEASDLVLVIWTQASIRSNWVIAEAQHGFEAGRLLPLVHPEVDPRDIPMPFGTLHTVSTDDLEGLIRQIAARGEAVPRQTASAPTSVMGSFFKPTERPLPSEPQAWDLSSLYDDPAEVDADIERMRKFCSAFSERYRGKLKGLSGVGMLKCLMDYASIEETGQRVSSYRGLRYYSNHTDGEAYRAMHDATAQLADITAPIVFFPLEIGQLTEADLARLLDEAPELEPYRAFFDRHRRAAPFLLTEEEEMDWNAKRGVAVDIRKRFDHRIGSLSVEFEAEGYTKETVGLERALGYLTNPDRRVRSAALKGVSNALGAQNKAMFTSYRKLILTAAKEDKARGYQRVDAARLLSEQIAPEWMDQMTRAVEAGFPRTTHRYYARKARWLGQEKLAYEDRNAPLPGVTGTHGWTEAVDVVRETFGDLSPRLGDLVRRFLAERWVDARPLETRVPGAFSHPTVSSANPFVHLHFDGTTRGVVLLASMMGHGVRQYFGLRNGPLLDHTSLAFSNAVAFFFETLATEHLMVRSGEADQKLMTVGYLEDRLNTIERQAMFYRFEQAIHTAAIERPDMAVDEANAIWRAEQAKLVGPSMDLPPEMDVLWSYVPHFFHSPFYTATYAFGGLLASVMYAAYLEEREAHSSRFADRLIRAMEAGGTVDLAGTLEILEIDPGDRTTWRAGIDVTSAIIDTLEGVTF